MSQVNPTDKIPNSGPRSEDPLFILGPIDSWMELNGRRLYRKLRSDGPKERLTIYLSTPGGDVKTADEVYQILRSYPAPVEINIFGECSSAGTLISSAAVRTDSVVRMSRSAWFMIHQAAIGIYGGVDDLLSGIKLLEIANDSAVEKYKTKVGNRLSRERIRNLLQTDYYMSADEARRLGFVDEVVDYIELPFDFEGDSQPAGLGYDYSDYYWDFLMSRAVPDNSDEESDAFKAIQEYVRNLNSNHIEQRLIGLGHRRLPENFQTEEKMSQSKMSVVMTALGLGSLFKQQGVKLVDQNGKEIEDLSPIEDALKQQQDNLLEQWRKEMDEKIATTMVSASKSAEQKAIELMQKATTDMDDYRTKMDAKLKDLADKVGGILTQKSGQTSDADKNQTHQPSATGDKQLSDTELNQLKMMVGYVRKGHFDQARFKTMTGRTFEEAVAIVG